MTKTPKTTPTTSKSDVEVTTPATATTPATTPVSAEWPWRGWLPEWFGRPLGFADRLPEMLNLPTTDMIRVEEFDRDGMHVVRAELPGVDPDSDVDITVDRGMLDIRAERSERKEEEHEGRRHSEFRYGSFHRRLPLPTGADETSVEATYRDGILEIRVPVATQTRRARIPIAR
jgi:HSP20 family protein